MTDKNSNHLEGVQTITTPRGKISRAEWPAIGARHAGGESLASIARDYRCTAPAIRYIVKTERRRGGAGYAEAQQENPAPAGQAAFLKPRMNIPSTLRTEDIGALVDTYTPTNPVLGPSGGAKTGGFDVSLREAMTLEISGFLVAFDAVVAEATPEAFNRLREAADRLLRATARIRIELERGPGYPVGRTNN
ncbi:MAG: hypothetical protein P4L90_12070 [Rhodopila sp.]|nr:hypothetical protein [Rhodopila sp.]